MLTNVGYCGSKSVVGLNYKVSNFPSILQNFNSFLKYLNQCHNLFDVYFYVNLKNAVSFVRFRSGFFMLQFVTSNSSISENTICTWVFFYSRTYIYFQTNLNI